jgi:luciferase family oxidoreductase group 1
MAMRLGICERGWTRPGADVRSLVQEMVDSARHVEQLGFGRFWLGEHHHVQTGWTVPDTLVSLVGAATSRIAIGIGGVLMTGRNPYRTALDMALLASAFPGRFEFGIGRSTFGGNTLCLAGEDDRAIAVDTTRYERRAATLLRCLGIDIDIDGLSNESAHHDAFELQPRPAAPPLPWLLGTSTSSMQIAARWGLPFACVHNAVAAQVVVEYRRTFRPSAVLAKPRCMVSVQGVFGRSKEHAAQHTIRHPDGSPTVETYARHEARELFARLFETYQPDEFIYTDFCADPAERRETYSAIAHQTADLVDGEHRSAGNRTAPVAVAQLMPA